MCVCVCVCHFGNNLPNFISTNNNSLYSINITHKRCNIDFTCKQLVSHNKGSKTHQQQ